MESLYPLYEQHHQGCVPPIMNLQKDNVPIVPCCTPLSVVPSNLLRFSNQNQNDVDQGQVVKMFCTRLQCEIEQLQNHAQCILFIDAGTQFHPTVYKIHQSCPCPTLTLQMESLCQLCYICWWLDCSDDWLVGLGWGGTTQLSYIPTLLMIW